MFSIVNNTTNYSVTEIPFVNLYMGYYLSDKPFVQK